MALGIKVARRRAAYSAWASPVSSSGNVGLALEAVLDVPGRLPVPPEHEPLGRAQLWVPLAASAASGSAIRGQSFQIRSSA